MSKLWALAYLIPVLRRWAGVKGPERKRTSPTETVMVRDETENKDKEQIICIVA